MTLLAQGCRRRASWAEIVLPRIEELMDGGLINPLHTHCGEVNFADGSGLDNVRSHVDALLGKHFALLGSTGTGKSTSAALILHRICEHAPEGHIVMIDPHGEYASAFRTTGQVFDVSNLAMPYWLMNFEEHCEAMLTSMGEQREEDADILAERIEHRSREASSV